MTERKVVKPNAIEEVGKTSQRKVITKKVIKKDIPENNNIIIDENGLPKKVVTKRVVRKKVITPLNNSDDVKIIPANNSNDLSVSGSKRKVISTGNTKRKLVENRDNQVPLENKQKSTQRKVISTGNTKRKIVTREIDQDDLSLKDVRKTTKRRVVPSEGSRRKIIPAEAKSDNASDMDIRKTTKRKISSPGYTRRKVLERSPNSERDGRSDTRNRTRRTLANREGSESDSKNSYNREGAESKNNSPLILSIIAALLLVAVGGYFYYQGVQRDNYIIGTMAKMKEAIEACDVNASKSLPIAEQANNSYTLKKDIFLPEHKEYFDSNLVYIQGQVELEKLILKTFYEMKKFPKDDIKVFANARLTISKRSSEKNAKANEADIQKLMQQLFLKESKLIDDGFEKVSKESDMLIKALDFPKAKEVIVTYLKSIRKPNDKEMNTYINTNYSIKSLPIFVKNKIYEEGLAFYEAGSKASSDEMRNMHAKKLESHIDGINKKYVYLIKAMKVKSIALKGSDRTRLLLSVLNASVGVEKQNLFQKALLLPLPEEPKFQFKSTSEKEFKTLGSIVKKYYPRLNYINDKRDKKRNALVIKGKDIVIEVGITNRKIANRKTPLKMVDLIVNGVHLSYDWGWFTRSAHMTLNHASEIVKRLHLNEIINTNQHLIWSFSPIGYRSLGLASKTKDKKKNQSYLLYNSKVYPVQISESNRDLVRRKTVRFQKLAGELEKLINDNVNIEKEVKMPLTLLVSALAKTIKRDHFITTKFAKLAVFNNYVENTIKNCPLEIKAKVAELRKEYKDIVDSPLLNTSGIRTDGSEIKLFDSASQKGMVWTYNKDNNLTSFTEQPFVVEMDNPRNYLGRVGYRVFFSGKHESKPNDIKPVKVQAVHSTGGVLAEYNYEKDSFSTDEKAWNKHINAGSRANPITGSAAWRIPPHILRLDSDGYMREMFVPNGRVKPFKINFKDTPEQAKKTKDVWLDNCAKVLKKNGELHLLFKFFFKYVFDSPVPNQNNLIGNNRERGDFHQTVYQTMDRGLGNKLLCDCDDLAEVYANIVRRQGKLAYVLGVPGHATCGWVDKLKDGYAINFLDTGPPRRITGKTLDEAMEKGVKSYDRNNIVSFNPRAVGFLLRFAGEQVRRGYQLDSRIMIDEDYGKKMVDVQEAWHFHFYLQGIETMNKVLETDKASANYYEISGLYRELGIGDKCVDYFELGVNNLSENDQKNAVMPLIMSSRWSLMFNEDDKYVKVIEEKIKEIKNRLKKLPNKSRKKQSYQFQLANILLGIKKPLKAYQEIKNFVPRNGRSLNIMLNASLSAICSSFKKKEKDGKALTDEEKKIIDKLKPLIESFYKQKYFTRQDDVRMSIIKYGQILSHHIVFNGWDNVVDNLSKLSFPKNTNINHYDRRNSSMEKDWEWIRLNLNSYSSAIFHELKIDAKKKEKPTQEQWTKALKLMDLMERAYNKNKEIGLGKQSENTYLLMLLMKGAHLKRWDIVDDVFDKMEKKNWTAFYRQITARVSLLSLYLPEQSFLKLFRKFCAKNPPNQHYFGVVYATFKFKLFSLSKLTAKIIINKIKDDPKFLKEYRLFMKFINEFEKKSM
ncbi:MAG: hypothetical protein COA79_16650 [Planctomycetota bacterium]|nr:MAG: hypothetical protein COA79_16650 [Planctomycetota bacterium]